MENGVDMDYGPFYSSTLSRSKSEKDADILAFKAISVRVAKETMISYDTDLLRMAAAWTGGYMDYSFTHMTSAKGLFPSRPARPPKVTTKVGPGWARGGDFKDPRPGGRGPLPKDWAQYKGLYVDGDKVVLSYTVGSTPVLEMPGYLDSGTTDKPSAFTRTFNLGPSDAPQPLITQGVLGKDEGPLAIDTLTLPEANPWKSWLRMSGLDFYADGRAVVITFSGDVWVCSGIDATLGKLTWKRFASGLYEPLGVR